MRYLPSRKDERNRRRERRLARECEVYLSGSYAEYLETRERSVPNWAWINLLAHAGADELRELSARATFSPGLRGRTAAWWQAVAFLSAEILSRIEDVEQLDELRRSVLVPLELEELDTGRSPRRPGELVRRVLEALDQHPTPQRT